MAINPLLDPHSARFHPGRVIQEVFHLLDLPSLYQLRDEIDRRIGPRITAPPAFVPAQNPVPTAPTTTTKRKVLLCC